MHAQVIEQVRQTLLRLRAEILALEGSSKEAIQHVELEQAGIGRLSRREAMHLQQQAEEGAMRRKRQLQKIEGALRRIEAGEYGKCFMCENEIDASSLSADPTNTRCVNCIDR